MVDVDPSVPEDSETGRNTYSRMFSVMVAVLVLILGPTVFGLIVGSIFGLSGSLFLGLVGFVAGGYALAQVSNRLFVYNEEWSAYVTNDPLSGKNVPYGPGLHFAHFWEERNKSGNYKLDVATKTFEVAVQTATASVTVTGSFQWRIDLKRINRFIGIDPSTVENGLLAFIKSFLTEELAKEDAEHARTNIGGLNKTLKREFVEDEVDKVLEFEHQYGILTLNLILENIKLPEEAQKTRDSVDEATTLMKVVATLSGLDPKEYQKRRADGTISDERHKQLLDRAMAVSGNNAKVNINTIEGGSGVTPMLPLNP